MNENAFIDDFILYHWACPMKKKASIRQTRIFSQINIIRSAKYNFESWKLVNQWDCN